MWFQTSTERMCVNLIPEDVTGENSFLMRNLLRLNRFHVESQSECNFKSRLSLIEPIPATTMTTVYQILFRWTLYAYTLQGAWLLLRLWTTHILSNKLGWPFRYDSLLLSGWVDLEAWSVFRIAILANRDQTIAEIRLTWLRSIRICLWTFQNINEVINMKLIYIYIYINFSYISLIALIYV